MGLFDIKSDAIKVPEAHNEWRVVRMIRNWPATGNSISINWFSTRGHRLQQDNNLKRGNTEGL